MKPVSLQIDRLLSNPSFEQVRGKLILVTDDRGKIIMELKSKTMKTIFGPFSDTDWASLEKKEVIAFVKAGEETKVFEAKLVPRERNSTAASSPRSSSPRAAKTDAPRKGPLLKWTKFAEGRMVGEPVKLSSMQKGFDLPMEFIEAMLKHLEITSGQNTKVVAYLDFRKVYHFMVGPTYRAFENAYDSRKG
ncbi:MAG TPA: hypothetical protein VHS96_06185 [Bacteroidia bacterium]|jgi:hypothetical protein|nr:hypothetical protein [Bacteroidia bacterium]